MPKEPRSKLPAIAGLVLAGTGAAHFVRPRSFEAITASAFPRDTAKHVTINGAIETVLGVGVLVPATRKVAVLGALGYVGYLAVNAARNR